MADTNQLTLIDRYGPKATKAINFLRPLSVGDSVTVAQMSDVVGGDCSVSGAPRSAVSKAIEYLRVNFRINIAYDRSAKAWKRTTDTESSLMCRGDSKRASKAVKRGISRVLCVDRKNLSDDDKAEYEATATQLAVAHIALSDDTRKKLPRQETVVDADRLLLSIREIK